MPPTMSSDRDVDTPLSRPLLHRSMMLLAIAAVAQAGLAWSYRYQADEWQHLKAAWSIAHGSLPYRDFFEHHTPGLWYLMAPWLAWARPELHPDRAVDFLHFVRLPFVAVWAVLLLLTWRLGRLHTGRSATAWMATCMLAFTPMFAFKMLEIRPDGIAVALGLAH